VEVLAPVRATGVVRTADKVPVPAATVGVTHLASGRAWVSWTNENGEFDLPGLPAGRYRIEVQQLGFETATHEAEFVAGAKPVEIILRIAALPAPAPAAAKPEAPPAERAAKPEAPAAAKPAEPGKGTERPGAAQAPRGQQAPRQPGQQPNVQSTLEALRQRLGQGGFQQVDATGQAGEAAAGGRAGGAGSELPVPELGPLGEASSSDAFLISGTVGRGATAGFDFMGAFGGFAGMMGIGGVFGGVPGMEGGAFPGQGGQPGGMPGPGGMAGPGGMTPMGPGGMGRPDMGPGQQGGRQARPGQGGQGQARPGQGGAQAQRGAQAPQGGFGQGMEALWGMQRILRLAANRTRVSFSNRFGHSVWDARPYSLTEQNPEKLPTWRESFGVNIGGPLYIPKIYNGREKTFYFIDYEMSRRRQGVDTFATVPLEAERAGDFSARGIQLYDPYSNISGPRTPLGSVIPPAMLDPASVGLLRFIPLPNLPGTVQNYHLQTRVPQSTDRVNIRMIHTINQRVNLQVTYNLSASRSRSVQSYPELTGKQSTLGQNVMIGLTQHWTARLLHDTRINWSRNRTDSLNRFAYVEDIAGDLGITGISTAPVNYGVPAINFTNFTDLNDPVPALRRNQTFRFMDNISYSRPKHTFRAGVEIRRMQNNVRNDPTARGNFAFTGAMTAQLDAQGRPVPGTGSDFADFLLGLPQSTTVRFGSSSTYFRSWGLLGYAQDDWRIHPRFTLNYGIRYEAVTPPIELFDKLANLDLNADITAVALVLPDQTAPYTGKLPRALIRGDYNNWSPRLGIAWRPKIKRSMTIRAGYGVFYNTSIYNQLSSQLANQPPHAQAQTRLTSATQVLTLMNGFPPEPPGTVPNTVAVDPNYRVGYAQIWNVSVETQLVRNVILELTYTGTKGTHLDLLRAPNRALPGNPFNTEDGRRIPNAPGFTYDTFGASSIYHALQVRLQKRMTRGMMLMGTYTFGKSIDNASSIGGGAQVVALDDLNFNAERGLSSFDIRHRFQASYMYELPFGERRRWARKGWPAAVFGNWSLNGNATLSTGTPFTARVLGSAANNSGTGANFSERADQVGDPVLPWSERTVQRWFNTDAFALPPPGRFGNAARNTIPGPGTVMFNFSVGKGIRFGSDNQRRLDLRWEVQNLFNTPNFSGLGTVVNASNFGRVLGARQMRQMDLQMRVSF
jgi:hypothetical protein